jgi:hypothetical protein
MFDQVNSLAHTILKDIQKLLDNATKPADVPPEATTYFITNDETYKEMRDGLCNTDADVIERGELEGSHMLARGTEQSSVPNSCNKQPLPATPQQ